MNYANINVLGNKKHTKDLYKYYLGICSRMSTYTERRRDGQTDGRTDGRTDKETDTHGKTSKPVN